MYTNAPSDDLLYVNKIDCFCVNLTNRCNLSCIYCEHRSDDLSKKVDYEDDTILTDEDLLSKIAPYVNTVQLAGSGEPTLHKYFCNILRNLNKYRLHSVIVTNFNKKFTDDDLYYLSTMSRVTVSLDTLEEDVLNETRIRSNIQQIIYNIVRLKITAQKHGNNGLEIFLNCVVNNKNIFFVEDLSRACTALDLRGIYFNDLIIYDIVKKERGISLTSAYNDSINRCSNMSKLSHAVNLLNSNGKDYFIMPALKYAMHGKYDRIEFNGGESFARLNPGMTRNCLLPWSTLVVTKHGMAPCCGNFSWEMDIHNDNILNIINRNEYRDLRGRLLTGDLDEVCSKCSYADIINTKAFFKKVSKLILSGVVPTWKRWHI